MNKLFLFIPVLCLLSFQPVNAQLEKGRIMGSITSTVGLGDFGTNLMNLGFTTEKIKYSDGDVNQTYKTIGFNLLPKAGIFIMDNLAIGADLLVNYHHQKSTDSDYKDTESMIDTLVGYSAQTWKDQDNDKYVYGTIGLRVGITLLFGSSK